MALWKYFGAAAFAMSHTSLATQALAAEDVFEGDEDACSTDSASGLALLQLRADKKPSHAGQHEHALRRAVEDVPGGLSDYISGGLSDVDLNMNDFSPAHFTQQFRRKASLRTPGNWALHTILHNNLGGVGPDIKGPEGIRYAEVMTTNGRLVDLLVNAQGAYVPHYASKNGLNGACGNVNLYQNNSVDLKFSFLDSESDDLITMDAFHFSLFDLDQGPDGTAKEFVTIGGFDESYMMDFTSVAVRTLPDGRREFGSTVEGLGKNDPVDPLSLNEVQAAHTVGMRFPAGLSSFTLNYAVSEARQLGRDLIFAGMSSLYFCSKKPTDLDFSKAKLLHSNLGGHGPDEDGPMGIRYGNVAEVNGQSIDLLINTVGFYTPHQKMKNGLNGKYAQVNLARHETVDLQFKLFKADTDEPITLERVYFSIFDFDSGRREKLAESVTVGGFASGYVTQDSELLQENLPDGRTTYTSSTPGRGRDNPSDPMKLTARQSNRAASFMFEAVDMFEVTLKVGRGPPTGRNFLFAGKSSVVYC